MTNVAGSDHPCSQHSHHAVTTTEIENLLSFLKIHHRQQGEATGIDSPRRKLIIRCLEDQIKAFDVCLNQVQARLTTSSLVKR